MYSSFFFLYGLCFTTLTFKILAVNHCIMLVHWVFNYALRTLLQPFAGNSSQNDICLRIIELKIGLKSESKLLLSGSSDWYPQVSILKKKKTKQKKSVQSQVSQSCGVELICLGKIRHVDAAALAVPSVLLLLILTQNVYILRNLIFL